VFGCLFNNQVKNKEGADYSGKTYSTHHGGGQSKCECHFLVTKLL